MRGMLAKMTMVLARTTRANTSRWDLLPIEVGLEWLYMATESVSLC